MAVATFASLSSLLMLVVAAAAATAAGTSAGVALPAPAPAVATAASGGKGPDPSAGPTLFNFGWAPVTFDTLPKPLDARREPKQLDYRCSVACSSIGMRAVLSPNGKPLCYFQRKRALGATYSIFGTWLEGEADDGWESTCRGVDELGQPTRQWAIEWNVASQSYGTGYFCGCCGCMKNCYREPPVPRDTGATPGCAGAYNLTADFDAPCVTATRLRTPALPICLGETATQGQQWGTALSDGTCATVAALDAGNPLYFCTNSPAPTTFPGDRPAPNDPPGFRRANEVLAATAAVVAGRGSVGAAAAALAPLPAAGAAAKAARLSALVAAAGGPLA